MRSPTVKKDAARKNVIHALNHHDWSRCAVSVRINGLDTPYCYRDIVEVVERAGQRIDTLLVPKVNAPSDLILLSCCFHKSRPLRV